VIRTLTVTSPSGAEHVWQGPLAEGRDAIALWRAATGYLLSHGYDFGSIYAATDHSTIGAIMLRIVRQLTVDCPPALAVQTLTGWSVAPSAIEEGVSPPWQPASPALVAQLGDDPDRFQEVAGVMLRIWQESGVFRDALPR
jgi:hypothetical protein